MTMKTLFQYIVYSFFTAGLLMNVSCKEEEWMPESTFVDESGEGEASNFDAITDTYADVYPLSYMKMWGYRNVHDPSILKIGDTYYCYSTDAAYGVTVQPGIQIRKSKDLINWTFEGFVFDGIPSMGKQFLAEKGGTALNSLWAPYILEVNGEYRLYYSLASDKARLSVIGLATSTSPTGPWTEKGVVVHSLNDNSIGTNAIDPTIVKTNDGRHIMYYGSSWDGIYKMDLNPTTGLALHSGDQGSRIVKRASTGGMPNGNLEGPEIIYNKEQGMYYLFLAYDWLSTKYNVRVARSTNPDGPFLDFNGINVNNSIDSWPMIIAPYKFENHNGWQGVSHPSVFMGDNNQYYIAHQGRPSVSPAYMDLHVRELYWMNNGWPVASPERYAATSNTDVQNSEIAGTYEQIVLGYNVVPGYEAEQTNADLQVSCRTVLDASGTINGDVNNTWSYSAPFLTLSWAGGVFKDVLYVKKGRDWENKVSSTVLLSGMNQFGTVIWGKKVQ